MTEQTAPTEPEVEETLSDHDHVETTETTDEQDAINGSGNSDEQTDEATSENSPNSGEQEPETFPREYVEKLRKESAGYRERAQKTDALAHRLHASLVAATGRLADPEDLPFSEDHLDDADALTAAVDDLLSRKPHLATRRVSGDVGQGASGGAATVDLAGLLRSRAS